MIHFAFRQRLIVTLLSGYGLMAVRLPAYSQDGAHKAYYLLVQGGWTWNGGSNGAIGEVAGGIRHGNWKWGIATGIDNAGVTSVPVLGDVRWAFFRGKTALSLFSQEGWNLVTQRTPQEMGYASNAFRYGNGPYWMGGLSWAVPCKKSGSLLLSAGVNYKQFLQRNNGPVYYPGPADNPEGPGILPGDALGSYYPRTQKEWRGVLTIGWEW